MSGATIVGLIAAGLFAVLVAAWALSARVALPSRRSVRMARVSRLVASASASWLGARLRSAFASRQRRHRIDAEQRAANARRLADTMGHMKGAFMKLGQLISFISDDIPQEYRAMLQSLQAAAPPMDFPVIRDVVESELGRPLERAFARFDAEPIAAASIGQVHRATLPNGLDVAVKVQYPGIASAIQSDLQNASILYRFIGLLYPKLDPRPLVEELRARIGEELDYTREAANQTAFAELYQDHPFIHVPRVIDDYSTPLVLTSELIEGKRFHDAQELPQAERDRYGEILYRFVFGSTIRFRVFNGDPHPGNYLLDARGRIVFLDFGLTKYFPVPMIHHWRALATAHLQGDRDAFRRHLVALEFIPSDSDVAADTLYDYFAYFYEPWRTDRPFTFTREWNRKSFRMVFRPEGPFEGLAKKMNMPRDFVFVNRIQWGVMSILGSLRATGNWHRIQREYLLGDPPDSEIGREIASWRERWLESRGLAGRELYLTADGIQSSEPGEFPIGLSA